MSGSKKPILYVKIGCSKCREALAFFDSLGVDLDVRDVSVNAKDINAMVSVSGQTEAPTLEYEDFIVADFSVDEFLAELREFPEIGKKLGIGNDQG